jgi:uncharacterized membrane protein YgaE (UPF0421/DUF939 family)
VRIRDSVADAGGRLRAGAWPAIQCGLAGSGAWAFAVHVLGHPRPFFASVAAVVAVGVSGGSRLRRTAELAVGVALGVAIGDVLVQLMGQGAWQIGVVVTAALLVAIAVGGTGLAVTQAGLQAVFVVALPRTPHSGLHRWQDALVGGATALLVAGLLPADPWREALRLQAAYVRKLAGVLRQTAEGIRAMSASAIAEALALGRTLEIDLVTWQKAVEDGRESARITPLRPTRAADWQSARELVAALTMSSRNLRVGVRRSLTAVQQGQSLADSLPDLLEDLASAVEGLGDQAVARERLLAIAQRLDPTQLGAVSLADQVLVGQLRVVVVDLLTALGTAHAEARAELPQLG